ncbi:MAG: eukaryotic translation initiation factor 4E [Sulfobacillus sp.]
MANEAAPEGICGDHPLNDSWVLWYHGQEGNYSPDSYQRIGGFSTVEQFWTIYNSIGTVSLSRAMFFLMRKNISPTWEDPAHHDGSAWLYRVHKKHADAVWLMLSKLLVGDVLCNVPDSLTGISISPKHSFVTIRIWNSDSDLVKNPGFKFASAQIPEFSFQNAMYKPHREPNMKANEQGPKVR